jgi:hypothetical protein
MHCHGKYNANIEEHNITPAQYQLLQEYMRFCDGGQEFKDRKVREKRERRSKYPE